MLIVTRRINKFTCNKYLSESSSTFLHTSSFRSQNDYQSSSEQQQQQRRPRRRVVITGVGTVSPIGCNIKTAWENILNGKCGITQLNDTIYEKLPCRIAARLNDNDNKIIYEQFTKSELRSMAPATIFALHATNEALSMAQLINSVNNIMDPKLDKERIGVAIGMGMIDLVDICETNDLLNDKGYNRVSPYFVPRILPNMAAGQISIKYGFHGPNHCVSTACATGAHSIGDSYRFICYNDADIMVCGASEACISPLAIAGFCRLRALCTTYNDRPLKSSRPFDSERNGFVMGEGSGILILEELDHARRRNVPIIAEIIGYGLSGDASHLTAPREDGIGAILAMKRAITDAYLQPSDIDYINAHATSTPIGDAIEIKAIQKLFSVNSNNNRENINKKILSISSTKGHHGHLLGAAGSLETIFTALACRDGKLPPTINLDKLMTLDNDDAENNIFKLNFVSTKMEDWIEAINGSQLMRRRRIALKNAFGFGGTNASLCISEFIE